MKQSDSEWSEILGAWGHQKTPQRKGASVLWGTRAQNSCLLFPVAPTEATPLLSLSQETQTACCLLFVCGVYVILLSAWYF